MSGKGCRQAFCQCHGGAATRGHVENRTTGLLDTRQEGQEMFRLRRRTAVFGVTGMKMQDGGAGFDGLLGLLRYFFGSDRQMGCHGGSVN